MKAMSKINNEKPNNNHNEIMKMKMAKIMCNENTM
jgi:hypothetical protein